jgi:hypothetical protein
MKISSSSKKFKRDISDLDIDPKVIYDLVPKSFVYNQHPDKRVFGYIAEEVDEIIPSIVAHEPATNQAYGVNYEILVVLIIEELRRLRQLVEPIGRTRSTKRRRVK